MTVGGGLTVTGSLDLSSLAVLENLPSFDNLSITGDLLVGGATTVGQFECAATTGICTFNAVSIGGTVSINDEIEFSEDGINAPVGITTVNELNILNQTTAITFSEDQNFYVTSGITTLRDLRVEGDITLVNGLTITDINNNIALNGITTIGTGLTVYDGPDEIGPNPVGVLTSLEFYNNANIGMGIIGTARAAIDIGQRTDPKAFVILPVLTDSQRDDLDAVEGGLIYNSDTNHLQFYNGTSWRQLDDSAT